MTTALQAGVSGMLALQTRMDAVGNNISNANTTGYKSARAEFADLFYRNIHAATPASNTAAGSNPAALGNGVTVSALTTNFAQGVLQSTGRNLDVAVEGNGFLGVSDGKTVLMTRNGSLGLSSDGTLIQMASQLPVVVAQEGGNVTANSTLKLPIGESSLARATSQVTLGGNLNAQRAAGETKNITATLYDSLGTPRQLSLAFTRSTTSGTWDIAGSSSDGTVSFTGTPQVTFDASGNPQTSALPMSLALNNAQGAQASITFNLNLKGITQFAQNDTLALSSQDGVPPGTLNSVAIGKDGTITGVFTNGLTKSLGQLATATFANTEGLESLGNTLYKTSANSGDAVFAAPGSGSHGTIRSGSLEGSNVDLTREFSDMIITQRGYQASSRVISTSDQMLQELMQILR